jgi:alpha-methylacyl-CoA racemase
MFYYVHSLMAVNKVLLNLGSKKVIENVASENLLYLCKGIFSLRKMGLWLNEQGQNLLDGGAPFYNIYKAKDSVYYAVGCIEQKFYDNFMTVIKETGGLSDQDFRYLSGNQLNEDEWPEMKVMVQKWFAKQGSKVLDPRFQARDCCVERVLT